jgi:hypothetical protein
VVMEIWKCVQSTDSGGVNLQRNLLQHD